MTRKRTTPAARRGAQSRSRAGMPTWAIVALLILAASIAIGRSAGFGPFAAPPATQAPAIQTPAPTQAAPSVVATVAPAISGELPADAQRVRVVNVIDGDTIDVEIDGQRQRVRYIGIDTPERDQPGYAAATEANRALLVGQDVYLARDQSETDVFDRLLRYIYLADGAHVNATLIANGWAQPVEYPPDVRHAQEFRQLAVEAAEARRGFWAGESGLDGAMSYGLTVREAAIRRGPGEQYALHTTVPPNTPLTVYGRTHAGDWLQVRPPSRDGGWIQADAVDVRVPLEHIPVPDDIP